MKKLSFIALCAIAFASCTKQAIDEPAQPSVQANWSSSDHWGTYNANGYYFSNDVWGSNPGYQSIWVNDNNSWGVYAQHSGSGIKSYPHVGKDYNKRLSTLSTIRSSWSVSNPSGGSYSTDYDIWLRNYAFEIMLWTFKTGAVGPIAGSYNSNGGIPNYTNQNIGGHTWNVYKGTNGSNAVFSFVRTSNTNSGTVDIKAICNWIQSKGWFGDEELDAIQFGWEITNNTSSGQNYSCSNYSSTAY